MTTPHLALRECLLASLSHVVNRSEAIFLDIGRTFPSLMSEMRRSLDNSASLVAGISGEAQYSALTAKKTETIEEILSDTRNDIAVAGDRFQSMHAADSELFHELDANIQKLTQLETRIEAIREDSIEMELVSLNAMTVALKSGTAGRAFSHITDELKHISMLTIQRTEEVTKHGESLLQTFTTFRAALSEAGTFHEELFGEFRKRLHESFERFSEGVTNTVSALSSIRSRSEEVKAPLAFIMQEIQVQDLIKQSIDHVVISLSFTKQFIKQTGSIIHRFQDLSTAEEPFVRSFQSDIRTSYQRLNEAKTHIEASISGFSLFTESFFEEFQAAVGQLGELEELAGEINSVRNQLREVGEKAAAQMAPILENRGLSEWKLGSQRLRSIIERFTIFTHKQVAGELGGFDVEAGTESGEFTLF
ncbi:MAG: hypothetical protein LC641_01070 [Spirochaeta sp.]|nr:hypothetical protein [Spirochaeta sp.]